jgi:hypothetical protein
MEDVITSPLQEIQRWIAPSSQSRIRDGYAPSAKPEKIPACKQGYAPFIISAETRTAARSFRVARHKSAEHWVIKAQVEDSIVQVLVAAPTRVKEIEAKFNELAEKWDIETAHLSSPLQKMMHPSYQAILGMSAESATNKRQIIRFLLRDLKTSHRDWFLMLSYLTQQNPISPKDSGKTSKMVASWLAWGEKQGLL